MSVAFALLTIAAAGLVIWRAVCTVERLHWTTTGHGYAHFLGFGVSLIALAAGALLAAIDAAHGVLSLAAIVMLLASAGLVIFDRRGPRR